MNNFLYHRITLSQRTKMNIKCTKDDGLGDVLRLPHFTTPASVKSSKNTKDSSFKSSEKIGF